MAVFRTDAVSDDRRRQQRHDRFRGEKERYERILIRTGDQAAAREADARRARNNQAGLRQENPEHFQGSHQKLVMSAIVVGFGLSAYVVDRFLLQTVAQFIVGDIVSPSAASVAVWLVPVALITAEVWSGWNLHEAVRGRHADEVVSVAVAEWVVIALVMASVVPTAVIATNAVQVVPSKSALLYFQLALSFVMHFGIIIAANMFMHVGHWLTLRSHEAWLGGSAHRAERGMDHLQTEGSVTITDLFQLIDRATADGCPLQVGPFPVRTLGFGNRCMGRDIFGPAGRDGGPADGGAGALPTGEPPAAQPPDAAGAPSGTRQENGSRGSDNHGDTTRALVTSRTGEEVADGTVIDGPTADKEPDGGAARAESEYLRDILQRRVADADGELR